MASCEWPIPVHLSGSIHADGSGSEGSGARVYLLPESTPGNGVRWPELQPRELGEAPGGAGTRGMHHDARHITVRSMVTRAHHLASGVDGAARLLSVAAPAISDAHGEIDSLQRSTGKRFRRLRTGKGRRESNKGGGGDSLIRRETVEHGYGQPQLRR